MELLTQDELARMTSPDRLALITRLWDSLEAEQMPLSTAMRAELDRRLETLEQDRKAGILWAEVKAEMERRCP